MTQWLFIGSKEITKEKFMKPRNTQHGIPHKPDGGLWMSPYYPNSSERSQWESYLKGELGRNYTDSVIAELKNSAKILKIDGLNDLLNCLKKYERKDIMSFMSKIFAYLDFEKNK